MVTTLEMEFEDSNGKIKSILLPGCRPGITYREVAEVMQYILAHETFVASKGSLVKVHGIKLHRVEELKAHV